MARLAVRDFGSSLHFAAGADRVVSTLTAHNTTRSYAFWVKRGPTSGSSGGRIFDKRTASAQVELLSVTSNGLTYVLTREFSGGQSTWGVNAPANHSWHHVVITYDSSSAANNPVAYVDGVSVTVNNTLRGSGTANTNTDAYVIGNRATDNARGWDGYFDQFLIYNRILNATDVSSLYLLGTIPSGSTLSYFFDEASGSVAKDSSGSGNDGTITTATYTTDVPMLARSNVPTTGVPKTKRQSVGGNLVYNPDFEYAPTFTAVQTTTNWIDGTATGSSSTDTTGWWFRNRTGNSTCRFDPTVSHSGTFSLKLSGTDTGSTWQASNFTPVAPSAATVIKYGIPILPSTSYIFSFWVRTNNAPAASVKMFLSFFKGDGSAGTADISSSTLAGTNDWTYITMQFTTAATDVYLQYKPTMQVTGNIMDAWYDDLMLTPTTNTTRSAAGTRLAA